MAGAFEVVMNERKALVDKIIGMMQQGYFFNKEEWNRASLRPQNPLSNVKYKGGNRLRLMAMVIENGYTDPRWATARQYSQKGYFIKKGEHGVLCEKWIFEKQKKVKDFPKFSKGEYEEPDMDRMIDQIISTSECPIHEIAQDRSFYSPSTDEIFLPLRSQFKDQTSFAKTVLHEMSHSTGAASRLNRPFHGVFGSEGYAKEELRAEIGALFTETDLGIHLAGEHYEDHSDYLRSWVSVIKNDYNEFFRACADAEKISERLVGNYAKKYELPFAEHEEVPERKKTPEEPDFARAQGQVR